MNSMGDVCLIGGWATLLYLAHGGHRARRRTTWGPSPGPRCRLQVRIAPRACGLFRGVLLQLEGADPVPMGGLVTGVDPVGERLDQTHQRRVRADVRRPVRGVVEHQL